VWADIDPTERDVVRLIRGGYELSPEDERVVNTQKKITKQINDNFVRVGAIFCKPSSKNPIKDDWTKYLRGDTDLQGWIDDPNTAILNVGFNLQLGWLDFDIDSPDPEYNRSIAAAISHLGIDDRFAFGRLSNGVPSHFLVQLNEDDAQNYGYLQRFNPASFRLGSDRYAVELRSTPMGSKEAVEAKQTVVPGSVYSAKGGAEAGYDLSVWYAPTGIAGRIEDIAVTTARPCFYKDLVRAVSLGTLLYFISPHWTKGNRQLTCLRVAGWLARLSSYAAAINDNESINRDIFCPIADDKTAMSAVDLICKYVEDEEAFMRLRTFDEARNKLNRNPDAKIPGWPAFIEMLGNEKAAIIRRMVTPERGASVLIDMAERYLYNQANNKYIDRERFNRKLEKYTFGGDELDRRHKSETIQIAKKRLEAFKLYEKSELRRHVDIVEFIPNGPIGEIIKIDHNARLLPDDTDSPTASLVFNSWPGWMHNPIDRPDFDTMNRCVSMLDELLGYLTRDNKDQMDWIKKWIAWTIKHPEIKQQIALIVMGGQGTGKSFFGNRFMPALMGPMLAGAASSKVLEGNFAIAPFEGKMFTFIDEAKFNKGTGIEEIKNIIRNVRVSGQKKFEDARTYSIYSRIMMASNVVNIGASQKDFQDRAMFYVRAHDKESKGMNEQEYEAWIGMLKGYFTEFDAMLNNDICMQHFMRYFVDMPCIKEEIESTILSAGRDPEIRAANSSWERKAIKIILESGYMYDINEAIETPFDPNYMDDRIESIGKTLGFKQLSGQRVMEEMRKLQLIIPHHETIGGVKRRMWKMALRCKDTAQHFYGQTGLQIEFYREFDENDEGENDATLKQPRKRMTGKTSNPYG